MNDPSSPPGQPPRRRVEFSVGGDAARSAVDPHWVALSALVDRAEANRSTMSALQAERAEICAAALDLVAERVAQRAAAHPGREIGDTLPLREVMAELAAALHVGERTVSNWLGDGAALVGMYGDTLASLRGGRIDERHASAIIDGGAALTSHNRAEYERLILPIAENDTAPATRQHARVIAARLQPDCLAENQRRALAERRVRMFDVDDGMSRLLLDGPTTLVHGIYERLTAMGVALADAGGSPTPEADDEAAGDPDERTLDQRRADIMCDLLLTGAPTTGETELGAIRATVQVTIPILTLAGLDDDPALLDGERPIDADTARALAASAPCWQRVMIHPVTHEPLRLDTYRPSKRLRRLIASRDQRCRWPGCRRPARQSDIDHTIAFDDGGQTCADNLEVLCRRHHTMKHASPWHVRHLGGGTLEFTSPTRRRYRNDAPPVVTASAARSRWARYLDAPDDPTDRPAF